MRYRAVWGPVSGSLGSGIGQFGVRIFCWIFFQVSDTRVLYHSSSVPRLIDSVRLRKRQQQAGGGAFYESIVMEPESNQLPNSCRLNSIRVETALSRYPVHRLARKGSIKIEASDEATESRRVNTLEGQLQQRSTASPARWPISSIPSSSTAGSRKPPSYSRRSSDSAASAKSAGNSAWPTAARTRIDIKKSLLSKCLRRHHSQNPSTAAGRHRADAGGRVHPLQRHLYRREAARWPEGRWRLYHAQ